MTGIFDTGEPSIGRRPLLDIIIDTDIGTDVDDAYAVLLALASPELNLLGLTMVHADVNVRAGIAASVLKLAGRPDIPIYLGESNPMNPERGLVWLGHEGRGVDLLDSANIPPRGEHAVEFIARTASERPGEVVLITIGPLTNAGMLVRDYPAEASKLRGIVSMASAFNGFGPENAAGEHNTSVDPEAMKLVMESGIPLLLVGLNVTSRTSLTRAHVDRMCEADTPLSALMRRMTEEWFGVIKRDATHMHDPLAVAASFAPELVSAVPVTADVSMDVPGVVTYFDAGPESTVRICESVDEARFDELFTSALLRAVVP